MILTIDHHGFKIRCDLELRCLTASDRVRSGYDNTVDQLLVSPMEQFSDIFLESFISIFSFPATKRKSTNVQQN